MSGTSHTTLSGGSLTSAENGWPCQRMLTEGAGWLPAGAAGELQAAMFDVGQDDLVMC